MFQIKGAISRVDVLKSKPKNATNRKAKYFKNIHKV